VIDPFLLERHFARYEFSVRYMLSSSDPESMTIRELLKMAGKSSDEMLEQWLGYTDSRGSPTLRQKIAASYSTINSDQVLIQVGAEEPIYNFFQSICEKGDHVIAHFPCYQSYFSVPESLGAEVTKWEARIENQWRLDPEDLRKLIRPGRTKAILVNFPHNPTGFIPTEKEFARILAIAEEYGIYVISDEVYRGCELDGRSPLPYGADLYEKAISLGVLSKTYGLPGLRLGWIATRDAEIYRRLAVAKDYTTICNPGITEWLGEAAIEVADQLATRSRVRVEKNLPILDSFMRENVDHFEWVKPLGGTMAFPRAKKLDMHLFAKELREKHEVLLVTGECFSMDPSYFRVGLGRENFPEVFARFAEQFKR